MFLYWSEVEETLLLWERFGCAHRYRHRLALFDQAEGAVPLPVYDRDSALDGVPAPSEFQYSTSVSKHNLG
jgi:hypothetical protein